MMQLELPTDDEPVSYDRSLGQFMTASWVAEAIVSHALDLRAGQTVLEPTCGIGRFLAALPEGVRGVGVEIDPVLAARAAAETKAEIVVGDIRGARLPVERVDAVVGNPPFALSTIEAVLQRVHGLLDEGGPCVLLLPAFAFQTSSRVVRWNARWSISQEMMPRNVFPGIRLPLVLARFTRDARPRMTGMFLYHESREVEEMPAVYRRALEEGRSGWLAVVEAAMERLGGEATVEQVCAEIAPRRPTATAHWRPKVRQQLGRHFRRVGAARYAVAA